MIIGGWQKNSLIDYPGRISCVIFLSGCNFDCPYCYNPDLARGRPSVVLEAERVLDFLQKRRGFLEGVVISGGEPTLNPGLFSFCRRIKQIDYPVKLDTNGSRPRVIRELLAENLIDYIAMDVKTDPFDYPSFIQKDCDPKRILESIETIMESSIPYEFRTTCIPPLVSEAVVENIARHIRGAMLYVLQRFKNVEVLHPEFFRNQLRELDEDALERLKKIAEPWVKGCLIR